MEFRTSDTFASSLGKLANQEQKAVKQAAFDLHMHMDSLDNAPAGLRIHKLDITTTTTLESNYAHVPN